MYDGHQKKDILQRKIDAFSIFKRGIRPEWEDPQNHKASELSTVAAFDFDIDVLWENLVLGLIGETIEVCDEICGCRVVDKYKKGKTSKPLFRVELWFKPHVKKDEAERIKVRLLETLADGDETLIPELPNFEYKVR